MHKRMSPHGDYDHMGDSVYLVNNFKIDKIYINSNKLNYLESKLIKASNLKKIPVKKLYKGNINLSKILKTKKLI